MSCTPTPRRKNVVDFVITVFTVVIISRTGFKTRNGRRRAIPLHGSSDRRYRDGTLGGRLTEYTGRVCSSSSIPRNASWPTMDGQGGSQDILSNPYAGNVDAKKNRKSVRFRPDPLVPLPRHSSIKPFFQPCTGNVDNIAWTFPAPTTLESIRGRDGGIRNTKNRNNVTTAASSIGGSREPGARDSCRDWNCSDV